MKTDLSKVAPFTTTTICAECGATTPEQPVGDGYEVPLCVDCRYHVRATPAPASHGKTEFEIAVDTLAAPPDAPEDGEPGEDRADHLTMLAKWFGWLDQGSCAAVGARIKLVRHVCGMGNFNSDADLARECGLSKGRISQLRRELSKLEPRLARANGRRR
jgi:hypothetical protein